VKAVSTMQVFVHYFPVQTNSTTVKTVQTWWSCT